jgi:hypothetical protein
MNTDIERLATKAEPSVFLGSGFGLWPPRNDLRFFMLESFTPYARAGQTGWW